MKKTKKKNKKQIHAKKPASRTLNEVKEMIEDLREAGMIFSDVARHFHNRVRHATAALTGKGKKKLKSNKKKKNAGKK